MSRPPSMVHPAGVLSWNRGVAGQRHTQGFDGGGHGVGGEESGTGTLPGAGVTLQVVKLVQSHVTLAISPHGLEHVLDVDVLAIPLSGHDGAAVNENGRDVQPGHGHQATGHVLVASGNGNQGVHALAEGHYLDGIGDDFPADQRGFHPFGPHGYSVADGDGAKLEGRATRLADTLFGCLGEPVQVNVARCDVAGQVGYGNKGFVHVLLSEAHGPKVRPGGSPIRSLGDFLAAVL